MKNYEGDLERRGRAKLIKNYRYANEREWRFVPKCDDPGLAIVPERKIRILNDRERMNQLIGHLKLRFKPKNIKYLIVQNENEILLLINHLRNIKGKFSQPTLNKLSSRILTADQIEQDV